MSLENFISTWIVSPTEYKDDIVIVDEGHNILKKSVAERPGTHWAKRLILLSA